MLLPASPSFLINLAQHDMWSTEGHDILRTQDVWWRRHQIDESCYAGSSLNYTTFLGRQQNYMHVPTPHHHPHLQL